MQGGRPDGRTVGLAQRGAARMPGQERRAHHLTVKQGTSTLACLGG